jgi:LppP/LprE lipoprotein
MFSAPSSRARSMPGARLTVALLTVTLLLAALASAALLVVRGCGSARARPAVAPSGGPGYSVAPFTPATANADPSAPFDLAAALEVIRHKDYTPNPPDRPLAGPLRAIVGICTGSVNGRCMEVFFFNGQQLVDGIDAGLVGIASQDGTQVVLELPQYQHGDPGCCPTGQPQRHTIRLRDGGIVADPPVPPDANNYRND